MEYYIKVYDQKVSVSKEVYKEFCRFRRKEQYFRESDYHNGVFSYDALDEENFKGEELWEDTRMDVESQVEKNIENEQLYRALKKLEEEDKDIIVRLYFYGESLRQIARERKIPVNTLQYRHKRALLRIRKIMVEQECIV